MSILLDTNVVSEVQRPQGAPVVRARVRALDPARVYVSAITLGELAKGVALLAEGQRKRSFASWLLDFEEHYGDRILPVDRDTARLWGTLTASAQQRGEQIREADGLIAATAIRHGLVVMTRSIRHFAATGVQIIDPWVD